MQDLQHIIFKKGANKSLLQSLFLIASLALLISCKKQQNESSQALAAELRNESRDYLRSALLDSVKSGESAGVDLAVLLNQGVVAALPPVSQFTASQSVFSSLTLLAQTGVASTSNATGQLWRAETLSFRADLKSGFLKQGGRSLPLNFSFAAGSEIKIYRKFANAAEAARYPQLSLFDLPVTAESARKMRRGDLFVLPVEGVFMATVDGSFLRSAARAGLVVERFLGNSLAGHLQSGLRGNLVVSDRFEMHLFKTDDDLVRVRLFQQAEREISGGASSSISAEAKYAFVPFSKLHQVSEIIKAKNIAFRGGPSFGLAGPLANLKGQNVLEGSGQITSRDDEFDKRIRAKNDGLLELSKQTAVSSQQIQQFTIERLNGVADSLSKSFDRRIVQPLETLRRYTDQELVFDSTVAWKETRKKRNQYFADYQFDLNDEMARHAFTHAVSGSAALISTRKNLSELFSSARPTLNFVIPERIAREYAHVRKPPVVRLVGASARRSLAESSFVMRIGSQADFSITENWHREQFSLEDSASAGTSLSSFLTRWQSIQGYKFGLVAERNVRMSGFISDVLSNPGDQPFYWFSRELEGRSPSDAHAAQFLVQAHNALGPVAVSLSLAANYRGELPGAFRGRLMVGLSAKALDHVFDARVVTAPVLWRAVAQVAKTFDNTFGLPFLMFPPGSPSGIQGTELEVPCDQITRLWGSFYCHFLANDFYPKLLRVQQSGNLAQRVEFLESFFGRGFGANKIGAELLVRVLLQVLVEARGKLTTDELVVLLETTHHNSSSPEANLSIQYGRPELLDALNRTLPPH